PQDNVRVELRVAGAGRPMAEGRGDESVPADTLASTMSAAGEASVPLEVAERVSDRLVVGRADLARDLRVTDPEEDADALRRQERQVERAHLAVLRRPSEWRS